MMEPRLTLNAEADGRPDTLVIRCPLCDWSARNEADDPEAAARITPFLQRAFVEHVQRAHEPPVTHAS